MGTKSLLNKSSYFQVVDSLFQPSSWKVVLEKPVEYWTRPVARVYRWRGGCSVVHSAHWRKAQCTVGDSARWACQPPVEGGSPACAHTRCSQPPPFLPLFKSELSYRQSCSPKFFPFSSKLLCSPLAVVCGNCLRVWERSLKLAAKVKKLYKTETAQ